MVDSALYSFCYNAEETLTHMFWNCLKVQEFCFDIQGWLHVHFVHCNNIPLSEESVIMEWKPDVTDIIFDLFLLMAKHHMFASKLRGTLPHLNVFIQKVKK